MAPEWSRILVAWLVVHGISLGSVQAEAVSASIAVTAQIQGDAPDPQGTGALPASATRPPVHVALAARDAEIRGTVTDAQGQPRPEALVELRDASGVLQSTRTDASGAFAFSGLSPGTYRVSAAAGGPDAESITVDVGEGERKSVTLHTSNKSEEVRTEEVVVATERFDQARNALSPTTGTSQFVFDQEDIVAMPRGAYTPLNQILLQAPGVVQGDYGELHIRGEMTPPQYRINGVIVPEGISGFGQFFDPRFAERIDLLTGALPAEYNYRTNIVEIQTKQRFENGGKASLYGGSYATLSPSLELSGSKGDFTGYVTGTYFQSENGILFPTSDRQPIHDDTVQSYGFAYAAFQPTTTSRWSLILGAAQAQFQIPNVPGQTPTFPLDGVSFFPDLPSADLNEQQHERGSYAVLSYQELSGTDLDYQVAFYNRYSSVSFSPDPIGDLIYRGIASQVERSSTTNGLRSTPFWNGRDRTRSASASQPAGSARTATTRPRCSPRTRTACKSLALRSPWSTRSRSRPTSPACMRKTPGRRPRS